MTRSSLWGCQRIIKKKTPWHASCGAPLTIGKSWSLGILFLPSSGPLRIPVHGIIPALNVWHFLARQNCGDISANWRPELTSLRRLSWQQVENCYWANVLLTRDLQSWMKHEWLRLIHSFASYLIDKRGQGRYISQGVRELCRFLFFMQDNRHLQLPMLIEPSQFDAVIKTVKSLQQDGDNATGPVAFPWMLGHSLERVAEIQCGQAVRNGDNALKEQCSFFLELHEADQSDRAPIHFAQCTIKR